MLPVCSNLGVKKVVVGHEDDVSVCLQLPRHVVRAHPADTRHQGNNNSQSRKAKHTSSQNHYYSLMAIPHETDMGICKRTLMEIVI